MSSRITLNLNLTAQANVEYIAATEDVNRTDAIHRALALYAFLLKERAAGQNILLRAPNGDITKIAWR